MSTNQIRFGDGAAYEKYMGKWSQLVGLAFIEWIKPESGLRWLDVGCGNGAFTELIAGQCAPGAVHGIDPSEGQLSYARTRPVARIAEFVQGDAMALPFQPDQFDIAVMPLVIFFVPDPAIGVAEMQRVVRAGGIVTAYAWDMHGGGFPYDLLNTEMRNMGVLVPKPPSADASKLESMLKLWGDAGLEQVETTEFVVTRSYANFDDYWTTVLGSPSAGANLALMSAENIAQLKERLIARLPTNAEGQITCTARANAIKGLVAT